MASVVQFKESTDGNIFATDGIEAVVFDSTVPAGSFVTVAINVPSTTRSISSVVDNGGNTYALLTQGGTNATIDSGTTASEVWIYGAQITSSMTTVTVTVSSAIAAPSKIVLWEVTGQHATTPVEDVAVGVTTTGTSHAVGPVVTAAAGSVLIGSMYTGASAEVLTNDASFTEAANTSEGIAAHDLVGAASTSWTVTSTTNAAMAMVLVAIQPAAAGGVGPLVGGKLVGRGITGGRLAA